MRLCVLIARGWVSLLQVNKLQLECKYEPKRGYNRGFNIKADGLCKILLRDSQRQRISY